MQTKIYALLVALLASVAFVGCTSDEEEVTESGASEPSVNVKANGHDYVDLGIEVDGKKVLWATMNVGASAPEKYGDYFAWGETAPKTNYSWTTYKWCNGSNTTLTKYNNNESKGTVDNKTVLDLADDAARQNWGGDWVMPTTAEWQALYANTTFTWTANYNNTGVAGYEVKGKDGYASKSIFLPAAGYFSGTSVGYVGSYGNYWSSSLYSVNPARAYYLDFGSGYVDPADNDSRCYGQSVRPVLRMASGE